MYHWLEKLRLRVIAGALVLTALLPQTTLAGGRLPCFQAGVFSHASVNALVLPYRYETKVPFDANSAAARLSALIQQETLFSMLKYGSVGATELISLDGELCDVRGVLEQISGDSKRDLRPGHGLVLIWGRIFEEGSQVYVQSYIRFLRRDREESLQVNLPGPENGILQLNAALPSRAVAMLPRRFTQKDLVEIKLRADESLVARTAPNESAPLQPLTTSPHEPLTYGVVDVEGDWMKIQSYITGKKGWVRARTDTEEWALRRFMPELSYLEGVIAYLRLRTASEVPLRRSQKDVYRWMRESFNEYRNSVGRDAVPEAFGLAHAMTGMALYTQPEPGDGRGQAAGIFQQMLGQMPGSAGARELAAITAPLLHSPPGADKGTLNRLNRDLLGALAIAPGDTSILRNLESLYEFAGKTPGVTPYEPDELELRLTTVKKAMRDKP